MRSLTLTISAEIERERVAEGLFPAVLQLVPEDPLVLPAAVVVVEEGSQVVANGEMSVTEHLKRGR